MQVRIACVYNYTSLDKGERVRVCVVEVSSVPFNSVVDGGEL